MHISSYPKIYNLGHPAITELFDDVVLVEEKVDGSQFKFALGDDGLSLKSKGGTLYAETEDKIFKPAVATVVSLTDELHPGWTYFGESMFRPKANVLAYDRVPNGNVILFDVGTGVETYLTVDEKHAEAERLGLEFVPVLAEGKFDSYAAFETLLETVSVLGGQKVEGVVIKNYHRFGRDGKILMGKYVSPRFREIHKKDWKNQNPGGGDIKRKIGEMVRTEARWDKAIQHLRDRGELADEPKDIGPLLKELNQDLRAECAEIIREELFKWAWKDISRIATYGFPEWYKERLARQQFEDDGTQSESREHTAGT